MKRLLRRSLQSAPSGLTLMSHEWLKFAKENAGAVLKF